MGARRHGQEGGTCPLLKCCKVFCALVVTAKRSVDESFAHYFHNLLSASRGFAPRSPAGLHPLTPLRDFCLRTANFPTHGKNPAGAHEFEIVLQ